MRKKIYARFPEGREKALTFSYDDGVIQDKRFVKLLNDHGMKGTFNINTGLCGTGRHMSEEEIRELFADGRHEVAVHMLTHAHPEELPPVGITHEVLTDRVNLEHMFGGIVRGMAYPYGNFGDKTVAVLQSCGIAYARTTVCTGKFEIPTDWLRLPATCKHTDPRLMDLAKTFVEFKTPDKPRMFYLWGHTYEFDDSDNWNVIEEFMDFMGGREDTIWYATNIEIYDYMRDYRRLEFSADCEVVQNPTARTLWLSSGGEVRSIAPGEVVSLA